MHLLMCTSSKHVSKKIIQSMVVDVDAFTYSFERRDIVLTMRTKSSISIEGETIHVDPMLLLQRLVLLI